MDYDRNPNPKLADFLAKPIIAYRLLKHKLNNKQLLQNNIVS
jgi:hypothetical protein